MAKSIEVIVSPKGEVTVQTKGYWGSICLEASKFLEQSLGVTTSEKKTTEYYSQQQKQQHLQQ